MTNEGTHSKTISSTDAGFPGYLDFNKLRSSSIAYLSNLSGKIWTDHNVHDPGITILEALIYALLDLGYRTNLPVKDLFTQNPESNAAENNFFTPAQILTNNPLTITDYRKLLIDIEGVKNAWLETDDNTPADFCKAPQPYPTDDVPTDPNQPPSVNTAGCECKLNGLYHVYVQLEKKYDVNSKTEKQEYDRIIAKIRNSLMEHRNLCEDFVDIKILCSADVGICADVELDGDANAEEVYVKMVEVLQHFFSPVPRFYTLQQMLDKEKSIEEIFAGRPYDIKESHGFVDTEELEQLALRRKIQLSDVYHVLFDIKGIKNVRNLKWRQCPGSAAPLLITDWELRLPENHIPEFSFDCSVFQFFKYGMKTNVDQQKYKSVLLQNYSSNGKILYQQPSLNLNTEIPKGTYHSTLGDYYSIQNELPHVYGIGRGDLPEDAPAARKAKALQLQGFLLFFDQLLANYLVQLKNIRSLFSFSSGPNNGRTYFAQELTNVPQLQKLLRFSAGENAGGEQPNAGTMLAYPTGRAAFQQILDSGEINKADIEGRCSDGFPPFMFCFGKQRDQAVAQLREDILYGPYQATIVCNSNDCYFFYLFTSSNDFVLISSRYYKNEQEAKNAATSLQYAASFDNNYRIFMDTACNTKQQCFSFDINLSIDTYAAYLNLIVEDESLYLKRRLGFLDHLLARFAEQFTDFALLSSGFLRPEALQQALIKAEEKFLSQYPSLSSNRGKAYNYISNGWLNNNVSGFERRTKALAGVEDWRKHYLCNFVVEEADKQFLPDIQISETEKLVADNPMGKSDSIASFNSLVAGLRSGASFEMTYTDHEEAWQLFTKDAAGNKYLYNTWLKEKEDAATKLELLEKVFVRVPRSQNIIVAQSIYTIQFTAGSGDMLAEYIDGNHDLTDEGIAGKKCRELNKTINAKLNNEKFFKWGKGKKDFGNLITVQSESLPFNYIDENAFEFYPIEQMNLTDDVTYIYKFRDVKRKVLFESVTSFSSEDNAKKAFKNILPLLATASSYYAERLTGEEKFSLLIKAGENNISKYDVQFSNEKDALDAIDGIIKQVNLYTYRLAVSLPIPYRWKFNFNLYNTGGKNISFESESLYTKNTDALKAAEKFYADIAGLQLKSINRQLLLESKAAGIKCIFKGEKENTVTEDIQKDAGELLNFQKQLALNTRSVVKQDAQPVLERWQIHKNENYIYKLVDKDNPVAKHTPGKKIKTLSDAENARVLLTKRLYDCTDINISGNDTLLEYKDPITKQYWYHYQVKCANRFYADGSELVLFQSINGYLSKEEALAAFRDELFIVLQYAERSENYGNARPVSLEESMTHTGDSCLKNKTIVCVPRKTFKHFGGYEVQDKIIPVVKNYPVKYITKDWFRFALFSLKENRYDWRSVKCFKTAQDAMQQFRFFMVLLQYSGNYYIEESKTNCGFYIYIREVLAQSIHGFATCEEAWGENGIEKFICVSQSEKGFHNYYKQKDCSHSFFVSCGNTGLIHPCTYETPERRDAVLAKLYEARSFNFFSLLTIENKTLLLHDLQEKPVAKILFDTNEDSGEKCRRLVEFFESVYIPERYILKDDRSFYLVDSKNKTIAQPAGEHIKNPDQWKKELIAVACYFPLYRKDVNSNKDACNYAVQIKLPGFNSCQEEQHTEIINCKDTACNPGCELAWQTDCCFNCCCEAIQFYMSSLVLLRSFNNYHRVYECNCGYYGIELHAEELPEKGRLFVFLSLDNSNGRKIMKWLCAGDNTGSKDLSECNNEIIAYNPQRYPNEKIACEAVARTKSLINSEGMHLVEHLLLRPHCKNEKGVYEDCNCTAYPIRCIERNTDNKPEECHFPWKPGGEEDPCAAEKKVCFTPGCDPYSFIATVALPAWPQRFRSKENREVIETLLYNEAPAHVMLRILWLNPRDFCCFETSFREWNYWLAKKLCGGFDKCNFLSLLFRKKFVPLEECHECIACGCDETLPVSCFDNKYEPCADFKLTSKINELFCWSNGDPAFNYAGCEPCDCKEKNQDNNEEPVITLKKTGNKPDVKKLEAIEHAAHEKAVQKGKEPKQLSRDDVKNILLPRQAAYVQNVKASLGMGADDSPANKFHGNLLSFFADPAPSAKRFDELISQVLKNKPDKEKNIKGLSLSQKQVLISNITWQYLDRICIPGIETAVIKEHTFLFNHLRKNNIQMETIYEKWNGKELQQILPGLDIKKIKAVLT